MKDLVLNVATGVFVVAAIVYLVQYARTRRAPIVAPAVQLAAALTLLFTDDDLSARIAYGVISVLVGYYVVRGVYARFRRSAQQ